MRTAKLITTVLRLRDNGGDSIVALSQCASLKFKLT
jgi:hypothetical protein